MTRAEILARIARLENHIYHLELEKKARPDRSELYDNEISNLRYELREMKNML